MGYDTSSPLVIPDKIRDIHPNVVNLLTETSCEQPVTNYKVATLPPHPRLTYTSGSNFIARQTGLLSSH
jgi:hypothetical protein